MIFCDMDGVLVDFDKAFKERFGVRCKNITREEKWEKVKNCPNFWVELPETKDARILFNFLAGYDFSLLTGLPYTGYVKAKREKVKWVREHFGKVRVITCLARNKHRYGDEGDILIDDYPPNVEAWRHEVGDAILHKNAKDTIKQLKKLLNERGKRI